MKKQKDPEAVRLGTKGGLKTLQNKGRKHYVAMARKRWEGKKLSTGRDLTKQSVGV